MISPIPIDTARVDACPKCHPREYFPFPHHNNPCFIVEDVHVHLPKADAGLAEEGLVGEGLVEEGLVEEGLVETVLVAEAHMEPTSQLLVHKLSRREK